jgi:outer membrane protein
MVGLAVSSQAGAQSLMELVQVAQSYDATYQAAQSQYTATLAKAEQAKALFLPKIDFGASVTRSHQDGIQPIQGSYGSQAAKLELLQPLYHAANWSTLEQSKKQLALAQAQRTAAEQDLILRVSQAYFDALAAQDSLTFIKSQKAAVSEQLAFAQRNFEVGTATITDARQAQARFDLVVAQELAAENELTVKTLQLRQLVGLPQAQPVALARNVTLPAIAPDAVEHWVNQALAHNPTLQQLQVALDVATLETRKAEAGHLPTLALTTSYSTVLNNGTSAAPNAPDSRLNKTDVGISFQLPLFAGFSVQNKVKESLALESKARSDLEAAQRSVAINTRSAFLGVQSLQAQVKAYEAAEISSQSALDANKLGYQVGVGINMDVLNAQSQLFDTKAKLAKARYDVLLGGLKLRQVAGLLSSQDIQAVQAHFVPD